jgi:hypothetical protein
LSLFCKVFNRTRRHHSRGNVVEEKNHASKNPFKSEGGYSLNPWPWRDGRDFPLGAGTIFSAFY